ncbi:MAG: hypothetical protein M1832_005126 [Thelocarpon impressellum]|nr:MAG: hypothetical protein M1832_005126 [Thelocarpon impressellum]
MSDLITPASPIRPHARALLNSSSPAVSPSPSPPPSGSRLQRVERTSFSSVKEDDCGGPQSFLDSSASSSRPTAGGGGADDHDTADAMATTVAIQTPSFCYPCGRFKGWKDIRLRGRGMSKSSGDLRLLGGDKLQGWEWEKSPERLDAAVPDRPVAQPYSPGQSPLERLPVEILDEILPLLAVDIPPNGYTHRNVDLISCLLTSRTLHAATLTTLYNRITIPHSLIFSKFLDHVSQHPALGTVVRRLDFSHFSSVGLGRTRRMNSELQMVTSATLLRCLQLTPRLQDFLVQEHLDNDIDQAVIAKLFCDLPLLRAIDFCAASSLAFKDAFTAVMSPSNAQLPQTLNLKRLSLHECATLPASALESLLPRLAHLTHLDLGHTQVTDSALFSIPTTARLTHLNLIRCTRISGERVVEFLTTHPALNKSLVYLNLQADLSRYRLLSQDDVEVLLPQLPSTLKALNLSGAKIVPSHLPFLLPLTKHLEELSLGFSELSFDDITHLFVPRSSDSGALSVEEENWVPPALHYLDLTGIPAVTPGRLLSNTNVLLRPMTQPLEVLEVSDKVISGLRQRVATSMRFGWVLRELGRRGWYVREPPKDLAASERDSGRRAWKMGAMFWGMRKIPVAWGEVGGLYGHYMFKK